MLVEEWAVPKVVLALVTARETAQAAELAQRAHAVAAAGEDLVRIGLVADVPDDAVFRRVVDVMQRYRQLDGTEVGAEVSSGLGDAVQQECPQLVGQGLQLLARQMAQVFRGVDAVEQCGHRGGILKFL